MTGWETCIYIYIYTYIYITDSFPENNRPRLYRNKGIKLCKNTPPGDPYYPLSGTLNQTIGKIEDIWDGGWER